MTTLILEVLADPDEVILSVPICPRCGQSHQQLPFRLMRRPIRESNGKVWGYYADCPETGDPILSRKENLPDASTQEDRPA